MSSAIENAEAARLVAQKIAVIDSGKARHVTHEVGKAVVAHNKAEAEKLRKDFVKKQAGS